jgi:hypothetical protein
LIVVHLKLFSVRLLVRSFGQVVAESARSFFFQFKVKSRRLL